MGAMLKSSGLTGEAMKDMSIDLTKLTADMASFHNLENDVVFRKIQSAMAGMPRPLLDLGVNMKIANLEAYALSQGIRKSYREMSQAEQIMLRYNYLLSATGDMQGDFSRNAHNWAHQLKILKEQWNMLKATLGQAFINALAPVIRGFNVLIKYIQIAAEYFKAFTVLIFGETQASRGTAKNLGYTAEALEDVEDGFSDVGKAGKKAGKDLKGALAGFDEINALADKDGAGTGGLADGLSNIGGVGAIDLGQASSGELDIDTSKIETKFKNLKNTIRDFYTNWGMKDIFDGIRAGAALVNFDSIRENFRIAFSGLGEIAQTYLENLQPIWQATGVTLGTLFKYGIATVGNIFEPISLGFANFVENMKEPIQQWITETSKTITNGYKNWTKVFEIIGESWLNSIEKYKPVVTQAAEDALANVSRGISQSITIIADTFEIISDKIKEFIEENKEDIQTFTDSIFKIFTDALGLINKVWTDTLNSIKKFWDKWGKGIVSGVMDIVKDIGKWFLYLWNDLVKPTWDTMVKWLKKIWNESLKGIVDELLGFVGRVGDLISKLWNGIFKPLIDNILKVLVPAFRNNFQNILDIVGTVVNGIGGVIEGLLKMLNGIIDFLVGTFTGDWRRAWEGVSKVFEGIMNGLESIFKVPLNFIISGINKFIRGLNNISIPDWVPGVGGKGFSIREIPHLAQGGITDGPMLAMIGDNPGGKEVVSPLDNLMAMIQTAVNETGNSGGDLYLTVKLGEDTLTEKVISNINRQNRISGETVIQV